MPNIDENLAFAPATELRELIAEKQVSPVEITQLYLDRIDRLDPQLNSYLTVTSEIALDAARKAEQAVTDGDELGPLHGIPISIKDLQMTKGVRTTGGSLAYKDRIPDADCAVVERVLAAGAIMLGKTNSPEFGLLGANENRLGEPCRNPWNPERTSGGSSGGAGASIIAGLTSLATGGDGGGSIRIPASFNGTYGIKPTQGRVSSYSGVDAPPASNYTSQQGPLTRTVRDSALLLQVVAGYDSRDPGSLRAPTPDFEAAMGRGIEGLRVGYSPDYGYGAVDPQVAQISEKAANVFAELGCSVEEADLKLEGAFDTWFTFFSSNAYLTQGHLLDDPDDPLSWYARWCIEAGSKVTGAEYAKAVGERDLSKPILGILALHSSHQHNRSRRRQYPLRLRLRRHARGPAHCWASWRRGNSSGLQRSLRSGPSLGSAQAAGQLGGEVSGFQSDFANGAVRAVLVEDGIGLLRESLPVFTMFGEKVQGEVGERGLDPQLLRHVTHAAAHHNLGWAVGLLGASVGIGTHVSVALGCLAVDGRNPTG